MSAFYRNLLSVLPPLPADEQLPLIFNILLVKYLERPSTLIDNLDLAERLLSHPSFLNLLSSEGLSYEGRVTEGVPQLWIWNRTAEPLLNLVTDDIHYYRGNLLGYPCPGYFLQAYEQESLFVHMNIDDQLVYGYICPIQDAHVQEAQRRYARFRPYAEVMGKELTLRVFESYL